MIALPPAQAGEPLVELRGLRSVYPDGREALRGIDLRVERGESVAIVGANGAGKSTLLLQLVGLLEPFAGEVRVAGMRVERANLCAVRRTVGLLLQDPDDQLFLPSVAEDVAFGPRNLGLEREEALLRTARALERVGASHLRDRPPHRLSAGEKRLCALAAVLALEPEILALDEPSSQLDPRSRRALAVLLAGLPVTRILVTHDLDLAWDLCPRTVVLSEGRIAADGPTAALMQDDALLERCGLLRPLRLQHLPLPPPTMVG